MSSHAMQSSLRDVLGWVWQTVLSWLASITSRFDDHLCLERPTAEMVVKAADPEMAVENDAKVLVEGEGGARVEKTIDAVLYIEEDANVDQMTAESRTGGHSVEVVEDNSTSRDSEESRQTAEHELVTSDDHNGSLNAGAGAEGGHSDPVANGASGGAAESSGEESAADSANKENSPAEGEASDDSDEDIDDIFPFADSIFDFDPAPREPKNPRGPSDTHNKDSRNKDTRNKDTQNHYVNEDDPRVEGDAGREEEEDTSVTWMMKVGLTKESYERALSPQYCALDFRSAVPLEKEMVETALKQLRSLLPWLGLGLKKRKKDMWLCLHPEGNINFKMTYSDCSLWDVIANNSDEFFGYMEDKLLHSFMLMNTQPCSQCQAFVDGNPCANSETLCESPESSPTGLFSATSGELSPEESSACCHTPGMSTTVEGATPGECSSTESRACCHAPSISTAVGITTAFEGDTSGEVSSAESSACCHAPGISTAVESGTTGEPSHAESSGCCQAADINTPVEELQGHTAGESSSAESSVCCQAPGNNTAVEGETAGESSSTESSACCHAPGISTATENDTCRDKNAERDEIQSSATGSDSNCPSPTSVSSSTVDSADKVPFPAPDVSPSALGGEPPSQEASDCASETASSENAPVQESLKPTPDTDGVKGKSFPHNYRLVFAVPQPLATEKSFSAICDGFILKLSTLISESAMPGTKAPASSDSTSDVSEQSGEECDERTPESVQETENESADKDSDETPSQPNTPSDSNVCRVDSMSEEMANVLQLFSVVADVLVTDENGESNAASAESVPNNDVNKIDRNSPHVDRTVQADSSKNFMNKCKSERISFISGFASCVNAVISQTLVKSGFWKEDEDLENDLNVGYSISHYYNMDDLSDHEWRDHPDEEGDGNDDDDDGNNEGLLYSMCCRKPTVSLRGNPRTGLKGVWETARIVDQKRKEAELQSRNTLPQIIPLNLENLSVSDSQFPSIFQPESNFSITYITDSPARLDRRLENLELLSCHPIHPMIIFFRNTCITLRVQEGKLTFSFYHRQQFIPNSAAHEFADEVESAIVSSAKAS